MPASRMLNPLKDYSWGSREFIQSLLNKDSERSAPWAELWMGSHPADSSRIETPDGTITLHDYIREHPDTALGLANQIYGAVLPFLMKVLAAAQPLSIQAHPSQLQAELGFARENSLGIPLSSPLRNYRDSNHKPELLCALTPFSAMCGFRPYPEIVENFRHCHLDSFFSSFDALAKHLDQRSFQHFFLQILTLPTDSGTQMLESFKRNLPDTGDLPQDIRQTCKMLIQYYSDDLGILAPLYLNVFHLQPGEALFLSAGVLHAYLEGAGIEIMANSDNVIRGGLTPKHVDTEELARILDFTPYESGILEQRQESQQTCIYQSPAAEFILSKITLSQSNAPVQIAKPVPLILLCLDGAVDLDWSDGHLNLQRGESVFVTADTALTRLSGSGQIWLATVPEVTEIKAG